MSTHSQPGAVATTSFCCPETATIVVPDPFTAFEKYTGAAAGPLGVITAIWNDCWAAGAA